MHQKKIVVIDAPSNLGLQPPAPGQAPGVYQLAGALRSAGLVDGLGAADGGRVEPQPYQPDIDPLTGVRNSAAIGEFAHTLAAKVEEAVAEGAFPLVLGGDCSILLGPMLALRRQGRFGLFFIDGHTDFGSPSTSYTGGVAGMDLALVCGHGLDSLADIDGLKPLVREEDVVVFGHRDVEDPTTYLWRDIFDTQITLYSLNTVREAGLEPAAEEALARLEASNVEGVWVHLDADVLDDGVMPAVDSRQPGGMSYAELSWLMRRLLAGPAVGMDITIFDPTLDKDGRIARAFTQAIIDGFAD